MGRSSAGGGGGGRSSSGGSFRSSSGHRSFDGGRSSRGTGGFESGGSFHRGTGPFGGSGYYGRPYRRPMYYGGGMSGGSILALIVIVFLISAFSAFRSRNSVPDESIQVSSMDREKLPASMTRETEYYQDDLGWIGNAYELEEGMKYFYQKTGVFPYLWITDTVDGDSWPSDEKIDEKLDTMYTELFDDEGHAILMYLDAGGGQYITRCLRGASAKTVLDEEATEILLDYLDAYATSDLSDEAYFSTCFTKAADRMMSRTTNSMDVVKIVVIIAAVLLAVVILTSFLLHRRKLKLEQAKVDSDILNSKL